MLFQWIINDKNVNKFSSFHVISNKNKISIKKQLVSGEKFTSFVIHLAIHV